jgi:hypothetical protein
MSSFDHFYGVAIREQKTSKQSPIRTTRSKSRAEICATPSIAVIADGDDSTTTV